MRFLRVIIALCLTAMTGPAPADGLADHSLGELESRLAEIDAQLAELANYGLGSGIGAIGYRSNGHTNSNATEWIQIDFDAPHPIDEIVLVPAIHRDVAKGFQSDAFPAAFSIRAGLDGDTNGTVIAAYARENAPPPGVAPCVLGDIGTTASWVRVESSQLTPRAFDHLHVFQFSEILVFSGEENVALNQAVSCHSEPPGTSTSAWSKEYVVDGFVPYLMDAATGELSVAYLSPAATEPLPSLTVDLEASRPISRIHLHAVGASDTLPQAYAGDIGIPRKMLIEGANQADFSDAFTLLNPRYDTFYDVGPIIVNRFPARTCRYVRFTVEEPSSHPHYGDIEPRFGFSEIEIFANGKNVALGKTTTPNYAFRSRHRPLANLTDGRNMYGDILPTRDWLNQLATRHRLETERPRISAELNRRYLRQKAILRLLGWLAALLAVGTVIIILVDRIIRQHAVYRTRERIAADLHDELGANIHAIGLLGDLAQAAKESPQKLDRLLQRMRALTERTGAAARYCTNMLEARDLYGDLVDDMRKTAARVMADLDYKIEFEGEEHLAQLKPRKRVDLFLFYKECLINIIRHSGASEASARLTADRARVRLVVRDNGHGLNGAVPDSLKRRARLLGAQVAARPSSSSGGTEISLTLKFVKFGAVI